MAVLPYREDSQVCRIDRRLSHSRELDRPEGVSIRANTDWAKMGGMNDYDLIQKNRKSEE